MKTSLLSACLLTTTLFVSSTSFAGCSQWGPVNYVYAANNAVLAIIAGTACYVSTTANQATTIAAVLATANANNKQGFLTSAGAVAIEYQ